MYNIKGNTIHSAFQIPANRGLQYCSLDNDRLNTIRSKLRNLQAIFIDKISMVGNGMFKFLNLHLQQIIVTHYILVGLVLSLLEICFNFNLYLIDGFLKTVILTIPHWLLTCGEPILNCTNYTRE